jgi:hypothetical protein
MESCENCKYWKSEKLTDNAKEHLAFLEDLFNRYEGNAPAYAQARANLALTIAEYRQKEYIGKCWRFPNHIETKINHYCGEFTQLYK